MFFCLVVYSPPTQWSQPEILALACQAPPLRPLEHQAWRVNQYSRQWWVIDAAELLTNCAIFYFFISWHISISSWLPDWRFLEDRDHIFVHSTQIPRRQWINTCWMQCMKDLMGFSLLASKNEGIRRNNLIGWQNFKTKRELRILWPSGFSIQSDTMPF